MGRYGKQEAKQKHNPPVRTPTYGEIALVLSPTYPVYLRFRFPAGRARGMPISSLVVFFFSLSSKSTTNLGASDAVECVLLFLYRCVGVYS